MENKQINYIKHYWEYLKLNYVLSLKALFEYRANLFASFLIVVVWDISFLAFGYVLEHNSFFDLIHWTFSDYCLFLLINYLITNTTEQFLDNKYLENLIPKGLLNRYLYIPGNSFLNYILNMRFNYFIISLGNVIVYLPFIIVYGNYSISYWYLIIVLILMLFCLNLFIDTFIDSIAFFSLKIGDAFYSYRDMMYILQSYTPMFFEKSFFVYFLYIFQLFYVAKLILPLFHGIIIESFFKYILILLGLIVIFLVGTIINWHYGLKKYEAFG